MKVPIAIIAFVTAFNPLFIMAQENNSFHDESLKRTAHLIVMIRVDYNGTPRFGAGIIFYREKNRLLIATAHHILTGGQPTKIEVQLRSMPTGKYLLGTLLRFDQEEGADIAVLGVEDPHQQGIDFCLPFNCLGDMDKLKRGDSVFSVGNPHGVSWSIPVTPDRISGINDDEIVFQSNFISPGHSGGGLLDRDGNLIGMTTADDPPFARALNLRVILRLVKKWGYSVQLEKSLSPPNLNKNLYYDSIVMSLNPMPLHIAAYFGNVTLIKYYLSNCENPNEVDDNNATPLHYAAFSGSVEALLLLLKAGAVPNALDNQDDRPLMYAVQKRCFECVKLLTTADTAINKPSAKDHTPLQLAIDMREEKMALLLIQSREDVNFQDEQKGSLLHRAVRYGQVEVVKALIKAGANVNSRTSFGKRSPLLEAIMVGYSTPDGSIEMVKSLIKAGAKVNLQGEGGATPLHLVVSAFSGDYQVAMTKILLDAGADPNIKATSGKTPLDLADEYDEKEILELLLRHQNK